MMRKIGLFLVMVLLFVTSFSCTHAADTKIISVFVNGEEIHFDVPPQIIGGRTMVPVRFFAESFGAVVEWDGGDGTVTIGKSGRYITLKIGQKSMETSSENVSLDVAPVIINGRTLVPLRAIAEGFHAQVDWSAEQNRANITVPLTFHYEFEEACNQLQKDYDSGAFGDELIAIDMNFSRQILVYPKDGRHIIKFLEDGGQRTRSRELSEAEYRELTAWIAEHKVDRLPDFETGAVDDGWYGQYLHFTRDGKYSFYMNNPREFSEGKVYSDLTTKLYDLTEGENFSVHYKLEKTIPGMRVLIPKEEHQVRAVWKSGEDLRVLLYDPERSKYSNECLEWYSVKNGKVGDRAEEPPGFTAQDAWADIPEEMTWYDHLNCYPWQVTWNGYRVRIVENEKGEDGLYLMKRGESPKKLKDGIYAHPIVIPGTDWVVCARADEGWAKPNVVVKINLKTQEEVTLNLEPHDDLNPVTFIEGKLILSRGASYFSYDIAEDKITLLYGDFTGLDDITMRPLQQSAEKGVYYTADYGTVIGKLDTKNWKFTPMLVLPELYYATWDLWVDERAHMAYIVVDGDLLEVALP